MDSGEKISIELRRLLDGLATVGGDHETLIDYAFTVALESDAGAEVATGNPSGTVIDIQY